MTEYEIVTDLPPAAVNAIGLEVFKQWIEFAMGTRSLGGKRLAHPTGRYAAAIEFQKTGEASVAIVADEATAPEIGILESGHGPVDLKTKLRRGKPYPIHRGTGGGPASMRSFMWARLREGGLRGFASIGPNSAPGSWVIPAMPAYSPALVLSEMAAAQARKV